MFDKYVAQIKTGGMTSEIIKKIIEEHKPLAESMKSSYLRYKMNPGDVPIFKRKLPTTASKIDNKLADDWFGEIIDTKVGYMFGVPIDITIDKAADRYEETKAMISAFRKRNAFDDLVSETGKFAAICGYDGLLAYIDTDGNERVMRIDPWELAIITETEITEPPYALRYYTDYENNSVAEFYDEKNRTVFKASKEGVYSVESETPHNLKFCPAFGVPNNAELLGDADKVFTLIDAYDRAMSDFSSEIEQFRLAYILFFGVEPDDELIEEMKRTGAIYVPATSKEDSENKIEFLTKTMNHEAIDSHLDRLEANIIRFAKHVNFTDAAFGGDITGPAMRFKLFMLEAKSKTMERKHDAALTYMFKVIGSAWQTKGKLPKFDYTQIEFKYTRNVPVNVLDEANTAKSLMGVVSRRTVLKALPSVVPDVDDELTLIEDERAGVPDLDNPDANDNPEGGSAAKNNDGTGSAGGAA